ncbi:hypothetical protein [Sinorhizobium meliloti]|uniref:hypothetical protein n=1 Tax=Rhizobium meliloti TaxID=382 RepID=UPI000FDB9DAB|nr:hypothetical protein [Sinorhizobium meliloti]RVI43671.1 hypothetical protein CN195_28250 [Sinorhizobium meliloti]
MPRAPSFEARLALEIEQLKARGYSIGRIAKECDVTKQTLWRISVGDARRLSWEIGSKVERGLGRLRGE